MTSNVYFIKSKLHEKDYYKNINHIIKETKIYDIVSSKNEIIININIHDLIETRYVNKEVLQKINDEILKKDATCYFSYDTSLYHLKNKNKKMNEIIEEKKLPSNNLLDNDEIISKDTDFELFESIPILKKLNESDYNIMLTQFKPHAMIGFSGSLKHVATGCTNQDGQIMLHRLVKPFVSKIACLACNVCINACPEKIIVVNSVAKINQELCTGCNACISSCPKNAIKVNKIFSKEYMQGLSEFSATYLNDKKDNRILFINLLVNIKPYYNCDKTSDKVLLDDIGVLASFDPVAIDKASVDLINKHYNENTDMFRELWKNVDGTLQFEFSEKLNIGSCAYNLIEL